MMLMQMLMIQVLMIMMTMMMMMTTMVTPTTTNDKELQFHSFPLSECAVFMNFSPAPNGERALFKIQIQSHGFPCVRLSMIPSQQSWAVLACLPKENTSSLSAAPLGTPFSFLMAGVLLVVSPASPVQCLYIYTRNRDFSIGMWDKITLCTLHMQNCRRFLLPLHTQNSKGSPLQPRTWVNTTAQIFRVMVYI